MAKKLLYILLTILFVPAVLITANNIVTDDYVYSINSSYSSNDIYNSSRFTQVDDLTSPSNNGEMIRLIDNVENEDVTKKNYDEEVVKNGNFKLYYNSYLRSFKVQNLTTGYVWSTGKDYIGKDDASAKIARQITSLIVLEYFHYNEKEQQYATSITSVEMTKATGASEYELAPNTDINVFVSNIPNGKKLALTYTKVGIKINVYVTLENNGSLKINIPDNEIEECLNNKLHYIANIKVAPGMGSNVDKSTNGYFVIPDGSGSLIRYGQRTSTVPYKLRYYGIDYGFTPSEVNNSPEDLTMPIYGMVNGINKNGYLAIIENGDISCDLEVGVNGSTNSKYNYINPHFKVRNQYKLFGINQKTDDERIGSDITVSFNFVENEDANYVGIANRYQEYLLENNILTKQTDGSFKLRIDALMSESAKALIGTKNVKMTSLKEVEQMIKELNNENISDLIICLLGWNKDGYSSSTPNNISYNTNLGSKKSFKEFNDLYDVYYYNDYVVGSKNGDFSERKDVARTVERTRLTYTNDGLVTTSNEYHYLYPTSSLELAKENIQKYNKLNIKNLNLDSIGELLYSTYYDGKISHRNDSAQTYQELLKVFKDNDMKLALQKPFAYLYAFMNLYLDMPLFSNQKTYYTDNVPLLPYVFRGVIDYYTTYTNFFANQEEQLLRSLDYGAYPSYILTASESRDLKYTDSYNLFTTVYSHWKDNIVKNYQVMKAGYNAIGNSHVVSRTVLEIGLVEITYSNNQKILIDYRNSCYQVVGGSEWIYL